MSFISEPGFFDRYDDAEEISLYGYQEESVQRVRDNFRKPDVHAQILSIPTGGGKTTVGAHLLKQCFEKGRRGMFVVDRISLLGQTSSTLDRYGVPHGVIAAGHPRYRPGELIQVASIHTLARRGWPSPLDLIINDECHVSYSSMLKKIARKDTKTLGLTATPFTRGLGKHYQEIVNVTTTNKLIKEGVLCPYKVWASAEPDMTGAKVVAGEWTDEEASTRATKIIGDVVKEYREKVGDGKAVAFGVDVAHCEEMQRQFLKAGVNASLYTYLTPDEEREMLIGREGEFRKPDSAVRVLISVAALSRGFDVPDLSAIIMCRPLKNSFMEFLQVIGRGLRAHPSKTHCIAKGQRVLCQRGLIPIDKVLLSDKVWDGIKFVQHGGAICRGIQKTITYCGLTATDDHKVKTREGWRAFGECAAQQIPIIQTGSGGSPIRERDNRFASLGMEGEEMAATGACSMQVRDMREGVNSAIGDDCSRTLSGMPTMQSASASPEMDIHAGSGNGAAMHQSEYPEMDGLWRQGDRVSIPELHRRSDVDRCESGRSGESKSGDRSNRKRRTLRGGKSSVVNAKAEYFAHATKQICGEIRSIQTKASRDSICGHNPSSHVRLRSYGCANNRPVSQPAFRQTEGEVWDILDCGPRNCFTCEGLLVHNCKILDLAGNFMRHYPAMAEFFEEGALALDDGKPKPKSQKPIPVEKKPKKCPRCKFVFGAGSHCPSCGYIFVSRSTVQHEEGALSEFDGSAAVKMDMEQKKKLYAELRYVCYHKGYKEGWSAHAYRAITGVWPVKKTNNTLPPSAATLRAVQKIADQRNKTMRQRKPASAEMELDLFA